LVKYKRWELVCLRGVNITVNAVYACRHNCRGNNAQW